jgi:uncharacterized protein (TIGR03435 family)
MNGMLRHHVVAALIVTVFASSLRGQQAEAPQRFEVASVKLNTSGDTRRMIGPGPGGRFTAVNVTLRQLVAFALGVSNSRSDMLVVGGPEWVDRQRFDVDAVAVGRDIPRGTAGPLVRALLEERFQLRAHKETTERPVYHLVMDRTDGRLGPRLRPTATDCEARRTARAAGAAPPPAVPAAPPQDPATIRPRCGLRESPGRFAGDGVTAAQLAEGLAPFAGRVVIDRTGLLQFFDLDLEWNTDVRAGPDAVTPAGATSDLPGLFTALREQLGLKLDDARGPVEVVIIDSASPLIPN